MGASAAGRLAERMHCSSPSSPGQASPVRRCLLLVATAVSLLLVTVPSAADGAEQDAVWSWPLDTRAVARDLDLPASRYGAGHRGVDLSGAPGETVRAVAPGTVTFAGTVAGVGVVTVSHGAERSTYQPVEDRVVAVGDAVDRGQGLGRLGPAGSHCATVCLHLGRLLGEDYLDPLERLGRGQRVRLVDPDGPPPRPATAGDGSFLRPVGGPVTSPFGMRVHPVTGVRKLHDGVDLGAPCGTPVQAAAAGTVVLRERHPAYGWRVVLDHGDGTRTGYTHLQAFAVVVGQRVEAGTRIGSVGTTGLSTGCHLHFMVERDGAPVDPMLFV
ncbi:hypothetical protein GCM10009821_19100 [Aeromicrobium halocynthiae]|uniref:M23ase beta-sheet core domain-containing protein n=1 Tax=Aeromicrobium halocynthiae TaxID=560557 RepID=A0ABN2W020_9ACTN